MLKVCNIFEGEFPVKSVKTWNIILIRLYIIENKLKDTQKCLN